MNRQRTWTLVGTTPITTITADSFGDLITFVATASGQQITNGSNLKLSGTWVSRAAGDTITLVCDGVNWCEQARSYPLGEDQGLAGIVVPGIYVSQTASLVTATTLKAIRFRVPRVMTILSMSFVVTIAATADDQCDVGILDSSYSRLGSSGATSGKLNATGIRNIPLTSSVVLRPGNAYYAAFACGTLGGTGATVRQVSSSSDLGDILGAGAGVRQLIGVSATSTIPATIASPNSTSAAPILALKES